VRYISADQLFNGNHFLKKETVLVLSDQNELTDIIDAVQVESTQIEKYAGIITPGFVNAHCHLELSHLTDVIEPKKGLVEFAKNIITKRNNFDETAILASMEQADAFMRNSGTVAVGDISNTSISFHTKQKSKLYYHTFIELIGLNSDKSDSTLASGIKLLAELKELKLQGSLAPHAPYSTSTKLIEAIANYNLANNLTFSIHNQESEEENKFLQGQPSEFSKLYEFLNLDVSWFKPNYKSSLQAYVHLLSNKKNILVHNTFTDDDDLTSAPASTFWCLCPSANLYIENLLPDYERLIKHSQQICFGTDSLASNSDLDILKEASVFYSKTDDLPLTLNGLTSNGASALDLQDKYGSFIIGKNTGLNLIEAQNKQLQLKKIICHTN
jgi:cytosine/adenosine deaminase-related metal-dependent hydrolase